MLSSSLIWVAAFLFFSTFYHLVDSAVENDEIENLPGLKGKPKFRQFSGYLKATGTRRLHYWFVESQGNPAKDPLVLWLNGGPGCSSLGGFLEAHGPFRVTKDGRTLVKNPYSWNKLANIIYLETPSGVGFSYSTDKNYTTSDDQTSLDNYLALKQFMGKYGFLKNDFYITGESYAGIYIPTLAVRIAADKEFNFKGFAIGNGATDFIPKWNSLMYFAYFHGLISQRDWLSSVQSCCPGVNSTIGNCQFSNSSGCEQIVKDLFKTLRDVNIYSIYQDCPPSARSSYSLVEPYQLLYPFTSLDLAKTMESNSNVTAQPPCTNVTAITTYLRDSAVRKALHIPDEVPEWEYCKYLKYEKQYNTIRNVYIDILSQKKYRILLYNGDTDLIVNFLGVEWFVNSLPLEAKGGQTAWYYKTKGGSKQIAGFTQKFSNFTLLTVKGAGHVVPQEKPIQAFEMITNFLSGTF